MTEKTILELLLEAQKKIEPITKDATAGTSSSFRYNYATLGAVLDIVKPILNELGLFLMQPIKGDKVYTIVYSSKENISDEGTQIICAKVNDPQAQGSAISYARRYGLMSLLCLSAEDDDGEKATNHKSERENTVKTTNNQEVVREPINPLTVHCSVCNSVMSEYNGTNKEGKPFFAYRCPNGTKEVPHPLRFV